MIRRRVSLWLTGVALAALARGPLSAQPVVDLLHKPFDDLLDLYVRDGLVYYQALRADRAKLDRYVGFLDSPSVDDAYSGWSREQQAAFWLNAYNAFVLRTVVDHYPIHGSATQYPPVSVRQVPGAFERLPHRAAGRTLTLDAIEKTVLPEFKDPRLYLALGRGALGSPRLRSEAFAGGRLEAQLKSIAAECPTRVECILIEPAANQILVTPAVGWHEPEFVAAYPGASTLFTRRSPIERAILAFIEPNLLTTERDFLAKDEFRIAYGDFDWELNDLTGRTR